MKVILNTNVILEDGIIFDGVVAFEKDIITFVGKKGDFNIPKNAEIIDANGLYTAPGLIDIHNHGSENNFFIDNPEECVEHFIKHGQTSVYPTFYQTYTADEMIEGTKMLKEFSLKGNGRIIQGLYMEGPYMQAAGSNSDLFKWNGEIDKKNYKKLVDELKGYAKIWAIDPARDGIAGFMQYVKSVDEKAIFALGHSGATSEQCEQVYSLGVKVQTHMGDSGKGPKINQAQTAGGVDEFTMCNPDMFAEIICDESGVHLSPYTLKTFVKAKGVEKIILITDSYPKTGDYVNNEEEGIKWGPDLNYDPKGYLAGSHLTLDNACRNIMTHTGYGLCHAIRFASLNPAKLLGIDNKVGSLKAGKLANIILIDGAVRVKKVFLQGDLAYEN